MILLQNNYKKYSNLFYNPFKNNTINTIKATIIKILNNTLYKNLFIVKNFYPSHLIHLFFLNYFYVSQKKNNNIDINITNNIINNLTNGYF